MLGAEAEQHLQQAEAIFDGILAQGARLPSQRRYEARARSAVEGVSIPRPLYEEIQALMEA
ncbi:Delta(1)-pyrroline-2-carboxylate/Delta(1)-piperideine-2-carboxylate reductase [compost metagenome]